MPGTRTETGRFYPREWLPWINKMQQRIWTTRPQYKAGFWLPSTCNTCSRGIGNIHYTHVAYSRNSACHFPGSSWSYWVRVPLVQYLRHSRNSMPEIIDPVFAKTSLKRSFSMTDYERFALVFTKTRVYKFGH